MMLHACLPGRPPWADKAYKHFGPGAPVQDMLSLYEPSGAVKDVYNTLYL